MQLSRINQDQMVKIAKAALYVGLSAVLSYLIAQLANQPALFGPLTPLVNVVLVALKQAFTKPQ